MQQKSSSKLTGKYVTINNRRIHYFEEGSGETILFVHGIPEWSMTYSSVIQQLSLNFHCIVPDHLGFGYSDKDEQADLSIKGHSERLVSFVEKLDLKNIHLVVHDLGGPIGIGALLKISGRVKSITISNTWLWNLKGTDDAKPLQLLSGGFGRWLYLSVGFSVKFMAKNGFADKNEFRKWYPVLISVHKNKQERYANHQLMLEMLNSGAHFDHLFEELAKLNIPGQFVWGARDKFFNTQNYLARWKKYFPQYKISEIKESGHFPHMESPVEYANELRKFITNQ